MSKKCTLCPEYKHMFRAIQQNITEYRSSYFQTCWWLHQVLGILVIGKGCCRDRVTATLTVTSHEGSQIPRDRLVTVIRLFQARMLPMVISSLPNVLTAWYSALYCPSNHSDINANVIRNLIKHFMRAHEQHFYRLCNCKTKQMENEK